MSDDLEFDRLKAALKRAEPAADPARTADAMARAMAEFDRVQGSADATRQMSSRPERARIWTGAIAMFDKLTTRAALAGTASVAVIGLGLVLIVPFGQKPPEGIVAVAPKEVTPGARMQSQPEATASQEAAAAETAQATPTTLNRLETRSADAERMEADQGADMSEAEAPMDDLAASIAAAPMSQGLVAEPSVAPEPAPLPDALAMAEESTADQRVRSTGAAQGGAASVIGNVAPGMADAAIAPTATTEAFPEATANPLKVTAEEPVSTFSIDVDTASYAVVRSSLNAGQLPPEGAVRIEEMVNYFPYAWPAPGEGEGPFRPSVSVMQTPWNDATQLVTVALQGRMPSLEDRPALNLVFLIDTSGSMQDANKLPLLQQSFRLMLGQLRPEDQVAIVTYAGSAGMALAPTSAADRDTILGALDRLHAGGSTAGQEGLQQAYALAANMAEDGEVTRVILATDGDFNVGVSDPKALKDYIARRRDSGTYLSVLGFGRGNLDDATMQALAQNGNGTAAYIDTLTEAQKVLVDQLSGALFPIADDVKIQVEWNPTTVAEYRLIGYETRALRREDFNNDRVDAGEIGAGHSVTAIYEITPVGSASQVSDPLRYGVAAEAEAVAPPSAGFENELGFLRLRYKEPGESTSNLIEAPIFADTAEAGQEARFAAAIAGMGQLLTGATYLGDWGWDEAIALANAGRGEDPFGYRAEAITLMRLAESLSR